MPQPTQLSTPDQTPSKGHLNTRRDTFENQPSDHRSPPHTATNFSPTSKMADSDDPAYQSRSRSQSRRRRRQTQRQRQAAAKAGAGSGAASADSMASIGEGLEPDPEPTTITRQPGQKLVRTPQRPRPV